MLERARDAPAGIDVGTAIGTVSKDDYQQVVEPLLDDARRNGRRLRILCEIGPQFTSFTPVAAWEDLKAGMGAIRLFEGCVVVTDVGWIRESTRLTSAHPRELARAPVDRPQLGTRWAPGVGSGPVASVSSRTASHGEPGQVW
ncbi:MULTISPECIES: STAS/SEC14 domain-containing protein [Streptomyces]|uniref:EAL domain-containing protein n=1 Tax=Streptomyces luteosporeus TaxID=173856 RepID=A0ABN3TRN5_9ACTN